MSRLRLRIAVLTALAVFYLLLIQKYRAYDIDNPWFLSFAYNAFHLGIPTDEFKQYRFPTGMDGVHLFGKVAAHLHGFWMDQFGWSPQSVVALNTIFAVASLGLLWSFLLRLGYRERWVLSYIALLGIFEPFVSMVEKARYEFLAFFLLCLALWLAAQEREFEAALVACVSVETEPAAVIVPLIVALLLFSRTRKLTKTAGKFALAGVIAISIYLALHPGAITEMMFAKTASVPSPPGGTFRAYFLDRRRHLVELLVFLFGAGLYWKHRRDIPSRTPVWMALVSSIVLILLHATPAYMVFGIPFLLWPVLEGFDQEKRWQWVLGGLFAVLLVGYGYVAKINLHEGFRSSDFGVLRQRISSAATTLGIPESQLRIAGDYSLWFAHPDHYRALDYPYSLTGANLYLCFDGPLEKSGLSALSSMWCGEARSLMPMQELSTLNMRGHTVHVLAPMAQRH